MLNIRICSSFRTISTAAVIAESPPIDIVRQERKEKFERTEKSETRVKMYQRWQARGDSKQREPIGEVH